MTLSALLVCVEEAPAQVLRRVLEELSIRVESCPDFVRAGVRLAQERFDVVIVDGESSKEVIALLRETQLSRRNDGTLAVTVVAVGGQESIREMFSLGVNFVLYKPVAYERALSSLRAARAVMRKEKRKNARAAVHTQATIDYANVEQERATLIDLAQDGMSVQFGKKVPPTSKVYFQFKLPGQVLGIRLSGQVVWQDWGGRAGIQFVDVPKTSRRLLTDFLAVNVPSERPQQFPDVTVEMEEPRQLATMSVAEQTHGSRRPESPRPAALDGGQSDPDHREADPLRLPAGGGSLPHRNFDSAPLLPDRPEFRGMLSGSLGAFSRGRYGRDSGSNLRNEVAGAGHGAGVPSRLRDRRGV